MRPKKSASAKERSVVEPTLRVSVSDSDCSCASNKLPLAAAGKTLCLFSNRSSLLKAALSLLSTSIAFLHKAGLPSAIKVTGSSRSDCRFVPVSRPLLQEKPSALCACLHRSSKCLSHCASGKANLGVPNDRVA